MLGIWLGFREFYTENQACGRNFLVLSVKDYPSVQYSKGTVICLSLVFYFILYTFPSAVWLVAQQNISVELKSKKNVQKGILYPERRKRKGCELMLFLSGTHKSYVRVSTGETKKLP